MVAPKSETGSDEVSYKPDDLDRFVKAKFEIFGEEMLEKKVKQSGNTGRVYLPPCWAGKRVKIIRID
jgi:hypothetical protein